MRKYNSLLVCVQLLRLTLLDDVLEERALLQLLLQLVHVLLVGVLVVCHGLLQPDVEVGVRWPRQLAVRHVLLLLRHEF